MYRKLKIFFGLLFVVALCVGLCACKRTEELDKYDALVYYDSNGGSFKGDDGITIVDGFKFENFQADEDGTYHFKLKEPLDASRPGNITITKTRSFLVGWYRNRTAITDENDNLIDDYNRILVEVNGKYAVTDGNGRIVDEKGKLLVERDGEFYIEGTETKSKPIYSTPQYTYSGRWDFEKDTFDCTAEDIQEGVPELRLYAGWVSFYEYHFYADLGDGWEKYGESYFNYDAVKEGSDYEDLNMLWVPRWEDGRMEYEHPYKVKGSFEFPQLKGYTFKAAYTDENRTQKIEDSLVHKGTLDLENGVAVDRVQNIYVEFDEGMQYRIDKAEQLVSAAGSSQQSNVDLTAKYTILNDLYYTGTLAWPAEFVVGNFTGEFCAPEGKTVTIYGAKATFNSTAPTSYGGLFGRIGAGAKIQNVNFADATIDIASTQQNQICNFGLFSAQINENATVTSVKVGGTVMLGKINLLSTALNVNMLVAGENKGGVTVAEEGIKLCAYGEALNEVYGFSVNPEKTSVEPDGAVVMEIYSSLVRKDNKIYDIYTWRQ